MERCQKLLSREECLSLKDNRERVQFILTHIKSLKDFRKEIFDEVEEHCRTHGKSDRRSRAFRAEG